MNNLAAILGEEKPAVGTTQPKPPPRPREDAECVTPNGRHLVFKTKPYRHYLIDGVKVASVTQITGCLDKPALPWWGMKIGVAGVVELCRRDVLTDPRDADPDSLVQLLTAEKLTVNHVKREAADRGSRVHDAMEDWAQTGVLPNPDDAPADERGYIDGLRLFIAELNPIPAGVETIVGSLEHGFAGRCDILRCALPEPVVGCIAIESKTGRELRTIIPAGSYLLDLKTTNGVFKEAHFQVAGYEGASVECGYEPTDYQAIVRVTADGRYEFHESVATYGDFLAVKQAYDASKRIEEKDKVKW